MTPVESETLTNYFIKLWCSADDLLVISYRLHALVRVDAEAVRAMLATDEYDAAVQADIDEAAALGASGVPFFVFDRAFAVSGAQPTEVFETALQRSKEHAEAAVLEA